MRLENPSWRLSRWPCLDDGGNFALTWYGLAFATMAFFTYPSTALRWLVNRGGSLTPNASHRSPERNTCKSSY